MKRKATTFARRGMAGFLALIMLFAALPVSVFAKGQSIEDILAELRDYDALYDNTGLVASYDFSDKTEKDTLPSGNTVTLGEGLSLEVVDSTKKVEDGVTTVRAYGEGYLSLSANNRLVLSGLSGDVYTVTANFAYAQNNAMPVKYDTVSGTYSTDWIGSRWRDIFTMGGLSVSASYMTDKEKDAVAALAAEYQALVAEYEMIDTEIENGKDTQITFLTDCKFKMPNGLTFGDVYYLLHDELQKPDGQLGTSAEFDAKYYEYLEYDANFYSLWKSNGIAAASFLLDVKTDYAPTAKSVLSASYGQSLSFSMAYSTAKVSGAAPYKSVLDSVWSNGANAGIAGESSSATAFAENITLLSDVAADVYAIRVYEGKASDTQIAQNHFADIAKYHQLNIFSFLRLPAEGREQVYAAFAGQSMTALTKKEAQEILDTAIENLGSLSFDYEALYVKDADGDGESDLVFDWNAFGKSSTDNGENGLVKSTTIVDKNGVELAIPNSSYWIDNALVLNNSQLSLKSIMPKVELDGFNATADATVDFMVSHEIDTNAQGYWRIGPMYFFVRTDGTPVDETYGPVSGGYWTPKNWGMDNWGPKWIGNTMGVPFHAGLYIDTEINQTDLAASTYRVGLYRDGGACVGREDSGVLTYTPTKNEDAFTLFTKLGVAIYALRLYDCVLTPAQTTQNIFADFALMFQINLTQYSLLSEDGQRAVREAVVGLDVSELDTKEAAQKAFDDVINGLPASQRYDYSYLYDHDIDDDGTDDILFDWDAFGKTALDNNASGKIASTTLIDNLGNSFSASKNAEWGDGYLYNAGSAINLNAYYPSTAVEKNGSTVYYHEDMYFEALVSHTPRLGSAQSFSVGATSFLVQTHYDPSKNDKDYVPFNESYGPLTGTYWSAVGWGTDSHWQQGHFLGNYLYETFRFGIFLNTTNDQTAGTGTYNMTFYRDGAIVERTPNDTKEDLYVSKELAYTPSSTAPKLSFGGNLGLRYYSMRIYTMPVPQEMSEKNQFADKMRFYGLDPMSYIAGSEEQRALVHELLDNEHLGETLIETIRGKYEAIYSEETDLTVEDLYAQDKLLFSFDAFDLDENTDVTTLVDKFGTALKAPEGASWTIEDGALVLGCEANGAITVENILANGSYTVQILMAYRSGAENGYNKADGDVSRDTFRLGGVTVGNVMNKDASYIVQSSPVKLNGTTVGVADGFADLDTYSGSLLAGNAGEIFEFTTVVNASSTKAAPTFYRNGKLALSLDAANYTASKDVVIGDYADLAVYAIRIYATRLGTDAITRNHFADLMKYYGVDMALFNLLTQGRREQLYADYADVALGETSYKEMTQSLNDALANQYLPDLTLDSIFGFDGYAVRLHSGTGLRAAFTLDRAKLDAVASSVSEIGLLHAIGYAPYLSDEDAEKTIVYNGSGFGSALDAKDRVFAEIAITDLTAKALTEEHYFRSYAVLKAEDGREVTVYGDMTSEIFGESISMTEAMARFYEHGTKDGGGLTPIARFADSEEYLGYIRTLLDDILSFENQSIDYAKGLLDAAQKALKDALAIKEGSAPADNTANASAIASFAAAAQKAALDALRQAEFDAQMLLLEAQKRLTSLQEAVSVLEASVAYGYAQSANLTDAKSILKEAEVVVMNRITDEMILISSSARNAAVLADKAADAVANKEYGANSYLRVLYVGDGDIVSLYDQMKKMAEGYGFDDVILGSLVFDGKISRDAKASYRKLIGGKWFDIAAKDFDSAVLDEEWNAVVLSPDATFATDLRTEEFVELYTELATTVRTLNANSKVYYSQGWAPSERQAVLALGDSAKRDGKDAARIYANLLAYEKALPAKLFDGVLPTATLLENLRTSVYLEAIFEWANGYELSELGAYAASILLLSALTDFDSDDLSYRLSSMKEAEVAWVLESIDAAFAKPAEITASKYTVNSGVHEDDDDVLTMYAMGASNISNGPIFTWLQTYMATRNPNQKYVLLNEGIPGETVGGGAGRINYMVDGDPDIVLIHYGVYNAMCNYFDRTKTQGLNATPAKKEELIAAHRTNLQKILDAYLAKGVDVILSCEGYVIKPDHNWQTDGYTMNWAYAEVTKMHLEFQAMKNGDGTRKYPNIIGVLDTTTHFRDIIKSNNIPEDQSGDEVIFNSDGLHISYPGGAVYTGLVINTLKDVESTQSGFEKFISDTVADVTIKQGATVNAQNATVSDLKVSTTGASYKYLANALPLPANADYKKGNALEKVDLTSLNREIIRVEGLASGNYAIKIDGVKLGTYTAAQLAQGVNIAEIANNPAQVQSQAVHQLVKDMGTANSTLNRLDYCLFTFYGLGYIDREGNFLYNKTAGRYYNEDDLRAYAASKGDKNGGWYASAMYACYQVDDPANSLMATRAKNQAIVNKNTYLMHETAKPIERTVEIVKE